MANYYTIITNTGKSKIANAQLLDRKVDITKIAVGDEKYNPSESQEDLKNEVWRGNIGIIDIDEENPNWIVLEAVIPSDVGGFNINEVGVFDSSGDMIAVGKYPETYKPDLEEGSAKDLYLRMIIEVSNASTVELKIDPTIAIPSQKWVNERLDKSEKKAKEYTDEQLKDFDNTVTWEEIESKPSEFPPKSHDHEIKDVSGLQNALDNKASEESVENLQEEVNEHQADVVKHIRVVDDFPASNDGSIIYHTGDELYYASRNGQWWRIYVGGDEKLEQDPPSDAPELDEKTDTSIKLKSDDDLEFMYEGGDWQGSSSFTGLSRNTEYKFYSRYKEDEVHKASGKSPSLKVTTDKGEQSAPSAPTVSEIEYDSARVDGGSGTEVRIGDGDWYDSPHTFKDLKEETEYIAYARKKETDTRYASEASDGKDFETPSEVPGSSTLIAGDENAGFYGEVPASELITGDDLASKIGLTSGSPQHSNEPWLKFAYDGKIQFVAKKTYRYGLSWNKIDSENAIYGDKKIEIDDQEYRLRLMRASSKDPSSNNGSDLHGGEWNKLMLPIHENSIDGDWEYPDNVESNVPSWKHDLGNGRDGLYTDEDLHTHYDYGDGTYSWCQETRDSNSSYRLYRGNNGVSNSNSFFSSDAGSGRGWRPVLELVQD